MKSRLHACGFTLTILPMWPKVILAWLAPSCHSGLILNVPSPYRLSPTAWSKVALSLSLPSSCFIVVMAFVPPWPLLICSSILCLEQVLVRLIWCYTPSTQHSAHSTVYCTNERTNEWTRRTTHWFPTPRALECNNKALRAILIYSKA